MNVEFVRADDEQKLSIASARWDGHDVTVTAEDADVRDGLARAFRRSPVVVDDPSRRRLGTAGPVVLQPGDLEWFRAVARYRATAETGLDARFVPGAVIGGFDPAAGYRTFDEQLERLDARTRDQAFSASHARPAPQKLLKSQYEHQRPGVGS